jgi:hypothetical protein
VLELKFAAIIPFPEDVPLVELCEEPTVTPAVTVSDSP